MSLAEAIKKHAVHGIVLGQDLDEAKVPRSTVNGAVCDGRLDRLHEAVFRVVGAPQTWASDVFAATAAARGRASHMTAARLWGLLDEADEIHVAVERERRPLVAGARIFRLNDLGLVPASYREGIPCMNPMQMLVHVGAACDRATVQDIYDRALVAGFVHPLAIERMYDRLKAPGRNGGGVLRFVLDAKAVADGVPDSTLELRMLRLIRHAGLPTPVFQHWVVPGVIRVDFAYPDVMFAIEVDGRASRATARGFQGHTDRQNALVFDHGWKVLRFTWEDVVRRPAYVARRIRTALKSLGVI